ncbi:MAG: hypothetical protein KDN22_02895 [Verrucomicrobiae bacterium]|nr:hypothetical protein [Verrucomicrobiae bacterium]
MKTNRSSLAILSLTLTLIASSIAGLHAQEGCQTTTAEFGQSKARTSTRKMSREDALGPIFDSSEDATQYSIEASNQTTP